MSLPTAEVPLKPPLLFLCHRIPFPPNKGDKIRSYHLLRYLSANYRVYLGAFVDDPEDWAYEKKLEDLCEELCLLRLNPKLARIKSIFALLKAQPLSLPYYSSAKMNSWVNGVLKTNNIERIVVYSAVMAQFVVGEKSSCCTTIADMVDVDSEKWREYSQQKTFPMSWVYRREADCLLNYEKYIADSFDHSLFVSKAESARFLELSPESEGRVDSYSNGVDTEYFSPDHKYQSPYKKDANVLVFTGAMDYWPNIDAVSWFAETVFPNIRHENPQIQFYIVGSNPSAQVQKLAELPGVVVTGRVEDVRPYLNYSLCALAPMRIARGIQNKVLEAMAMALPVIVSEAGLEGIEAEHGRDVFIVKQTKDYVDFVHDIFGKKNNIGSVARAHVKKNFNWSNNLPLVGRLLEEKRVVHKHNGRNT